jgi:hypothetical protein
MEPRHARVYYELRNGELEAAFPVFVDGQPIAKSGYLEDVNRRAELARLIVGSELLSSAAVNRMWAHFLGFGFTKPVDDMGPHNPPIYPELFAYLNTQFRSQDYDLKQLMQWIVLSEPYALSSRMTSRNEADDPTRGLPPRYSHFYLRQMSPEQLFESLRVVRREEGAPADSKDQQEARRRWVRQFTIGFETDEGDEATTFDGTIAQTLMMFNGNLMKQATDPRKNTFLRRIIEDTGNSVAQRISQLYAAALGRQPTRHEINQAHRALATYSEDPSTGWRDLWWALLNSNEFILIH